MPTIKTVKDSSKDNDGEDSDAQMDEGILANGAEANGKEGEEDGVVLKEKETVKVNDKKRQRIGDGNKSDKDSEDSEEGKIELNDSNKKTSGGSRSKNDTNEKDLHRGGGGGGGDDDGDGDGDEDGGGQVKNTDTTGTSTAGTIRKDSDIDENVDKMEDTGENDDPDDHDDDKNDEDDSKVSKNDKDYEENEDSNIDEDEEDDDDGDDDDDDERTDTEDDDYDDVKPRRSSLRTTRKRSRTVSTKTPSKKSSRNKSRSRDDDDSSNNEDDNDNDNDNDNDDNIKEGKPTFEPIVDLDAGTVTFSTPAVHQQLICTLCNGLFRDPFTISECLHTFCKTCIFFAFQDIGLTSCPRCKVSLGPDPFKFIMFDRTMQELVDKLFPELKEQDMQEEKVFFEMLDKGEDVAYNAANVVVERFEKGRRGEIDGHNSKSKSNSAGTGTGTGTDVAAHSTEVATTSTSLSSSRRVAQSKHNLRNNDSNSSSSCTTRSRQIAKKYTPPPDEMSLGLYPLKAGGRRGCQLPALKKPLLQTSGRLRIIHLKKYIVHQLALKSIPPQSIEVRCNGDHVGDELSLTFIKKTRWLDVTKDLILHYRLDGQSTIV